MELVWGWLNSIKSRVRVHVKKRRRFILIAWLVLIQTG